MHRDVSPENVILAGGHALLTNLGVARALDTAAEATLTDTGTLIGSAAYMSPEQAEGARSVDGRSDLYALGVVLFEMLTGEPLFSGPTPQAIMAKRAATPMPERWKVAQLPVAIRGVLLRALARDRDRRYSSMDEFASALGKALPTGPGRRWSWRELTTWLDRLRS